MVDESRRIERAAALIRNSNRIVAFTGAGISTASGIPDFRSSSSSLWQNANPMDVASLHAFRRNPGVFYEWIRPLIQNLIDAKPNAGHAALARLEQLGKLRAIITQNIDGLHQAAGSTTVYELHGNLRTATCSYCFRKYDVLPIVQDLLKHNTLPYCDCHSRGAIIKPDIILFGEQLPYTAIMSSKRALFNADLLIVAGSSLQVAPAGNLPRSALEYGTRLLIINYEPTPVDSYADLVINSDVNDILPSILEQLERLS